MTGYRIWPAMLLAVLGVAAAAAITLSDVGTLSGGDCADGLEWAAVSTVPGSGAEEDPLLADYRQQVRPILSGCLDIDDLRRLDPGEIPDPRS